jgi:hypothetical protein
MCGRSDGRNTTEHAARNKLFEDVEDDGDSQKDSFHDVEWREDRGRSFVMEVVANKEGQCEIILSCE